MMHLSGGMDPIGRAIHAFITRSEGHSYRCYTHPHRTHRYVDEVVVTNGITYYYLHGNNIARLTQHQLMLRTTGYPTQLTRSRLDAIVYNLNIPCRVYMRMPYGHSIALYLGCGERIGSYEMYYLIPDESFVTIDLLTHKVINGIRYIPSFIIRPSRATRRHISYRRDGSYYIIHNGSQYLNIGNERFKYFEDYGGWMHVDDYETYMHQQDPLSYDPEA